MEIATKMINNILNLQALIACTVEQIKYIKAPLSVMVEDAMVKKINPQNRKQKRETEKKTKLAKEGFLKDFTKIEKTLEFMEDKIYEMMDDNLQDRVDEKIDLIFKNLK